MDCSLLELIKEIIVWDLRDIDNNAPMNWYRTVKSDPPNHRTRGGAEDAGIFFIRLVRTVEKRSPGNRKDYP